MGMNAANDSAIREGASKRQLRPRGLLGFALIGLAAIGLSITLAGCASGGSAGAAADIVTISGSVTYRERIALPVGSTVEVRLEDTALADAPAKLLAQQTISPQGQVPIPFQLSVDRAGIDARARPSLRANIKDAAGRLLFTTTSHEAVDLSHDTTDRMLMLQNVSRTTPTAEPH